MGMYCMVTRRLGHLVIPTYIDKSQYVNIKRHDTSHDMWKTLEAVHSEKAFQTAVDYERALFQAHATEDDDISDHVHRLQENWDRLNEFDDDAFTVPPEQFKGIIAASLPSSWDNYIQPYVGKRKGDSANKEAKYNIGVRDFIGMIKEEYKRREQVKKNNRKEPKKAKHTLFFQGSSSGKRKFADDLLSDAGPPAKHSFQNRIQGAPPINSC